MILAGVAVGALALAKYSAVFFAPIAGLLTLVRLARRAPVLRQRGGWRRLGALLGAQAAATAIAVGVIWAGYGFRFAATPDGRDPTAWNWTGITARPDGSVGAVGAAVRLAHEHRLLPAAWLYGLAYVDAAAQSRRAFLAGEFSLRGWREFFPVAFLIKTTLGAQGLLLLALLLPWRLRQRRTTRWLYRLAPLLVFLGVYGTLAVTSSINIGHRHILPLYPPLYILAGSIGLALAPAPRRWLLALGVGALLAWHVGASFAVRPYYLASFNELIGGPAHGYRYLVDSSLDWGQGLPDLRRWLDGHASGRRVYLSYFGTDRPARLGLDVTRLADHALDSTRRPPPPRTLEPGLYCISATMLQQPYASRPGRWNLTWEELYQRGRGRELGRVFKRDE